MYKGTATLTCEADYFSVGAVVQCGHDGKFKQTASPECIGEFSALSFHRFLIITKYSCCYLFYDYSCYFVKHKLFLDGNMRERETHSEGPSFSIIMIIGILRDETVHLWG